MRYRVKEVRSGPFGGGGASKVFTKLADSFADNFATRAVAGARGRTEFSANLGMTHDLVTYRAAQPKFRGSLTKTRERVDHPVRNPAAVRRFSRRVFMKKGS